MDEAKKRNMFSRIVMGLILVPIALLVVIYAPRIVYFAITLVIILSIVREFIPISQCGKVDKLQAVLMWVGAVIIPVGFYFNSFLIVATLMFFIMFAVFVAKMASDNPIENVSNDVGRNFLSIIFVPFLFSFTMLIRDISPVWLIFTLFVVWSADSFAYFTGMAIGKHKLIPRVSPAKTVEGLIGGVVGALIIAHLFNYFLLDISPIMLTIISIEIIVASVIGDLVESMLKRSACIKDSGHVIPGHGGMFDRFDSLLFAAPATYFYLALIIKSVE